ncbi:MAG: hypothetical protein DRJ38_10340, partial [Thermoprotei archaeon]
MTEKCVIFDIGQVVNIPEASPVGLIIFFRSEALFKVGVLKEVLEIVASMGFPIVYFILSQPKPSAPITGFLVIDATNKHDKVQELIKKVRKHEDVEKVELMKPLFDNILVNTFYDILCIAGERCIIFRKALYSALIKTVREFFGTGGGALLYHIGTVIGSRAFEDHKKMVGEELSKLVKASEALFKALGFGEVQILELNMKDGKAKVRIMNN